MEKTFKSWKSIDKQSEFLKEGERLTTLFEKSDDTIKSLATGLIQDASYLYAENKILRAMLDETGMVRVNPNNPQQQRPIEAAKQYRANCDTYASIMGRLYRMLNTQDEEEENDMEEFESGS